jgi:hypothetical protein
MGQLKLNFYRGGYCVNSLDWNRSNVDLLAAGYGPAEFNDAAKFGNEQYGFILVEKLRQAGIGTTAGLIALWTLKNPECPTRLIRSSVGVTSLDFSTEHPQLLAGILAFVILTCIFNEF